MCGRRFVSPVLLCEFESASIVDHSANDLRDVLAVVQAGMMSANQRQVEFVEHVRHAARVNSRLVERIEGGLEIDPASIVQGNLMLLDAQQGQLRGEHGAQIPIAARHEGPAMRGSSGGGGRGAG